MGGKLEHIGKAEMERMIVDYKAGKKTWTQFADDLGVSLGSLVLHRQQLGFTEKFNGRNQAKAAADGGVKIPIKPASHKAAKRYSRPPVWRDVAELAVGETISAVKLMDGDVTLIMRGGWGLRVAGHNVVLKLVKKEDLAAWGARVYGEYKRREEEFALAKMLKGDVSPMPGDHPPTVANGAADVQG